ncbi:MAG: GntR family transcriptional regulator [Tunicatimonas sp.]
MLKYQTIYHSLKEGIQRGDFVTGDLLPSENELCEQYQITRTTARKALGQLREEGFIERIHGKGSQVKERRQSLGLLNVKGFSEAVGQQVGTRLLQSPGLRTWSPDIAFPVSPSERSSPCLHFERLRSVDDDPVMLENNWFADTALPNFAQDAFVDGSFFKTLSQRFLIEITGSQQELRAELADHKIAELLLVAARHPVLRISIKFSTSNPCLNIYSELYCNTTRYPIGNTYHL